MLLVSAYHSLKHVLKQHSNSFKCKLKARLHVSYFIQVGQLSQGDRAAGWVSFRQKWKTN